MNYKSLFIVLGFSPKENAAEVWTKKYPQADGYSIEINLENQTIKNYLYYNEKIIRRKIKVRCRKPQIKL